MTVRNAIEVTSKSTRNDDAAAQSAFVGRDTVARDDAVVVVRINVPAVRSK